MLEARGGQGYTQRMSRSEPSYVLCIKNRGYSASLEVRKIYRVISDSAAEGRGLIRVVDESKEDYLYPEGFFVNIEVPREASRVFQARAN